MKLRDFALYFTLTPIIRLAEGNELTLSPLP